MTLPIASVGSLVVRDASGNDMMTLTPDQALTWLKSQNGGGGLNLTTVGQAVGAVGAAFQIRDVRNLRDDARDARRDLRDAQADLQSYLRSAGASVSGVEFAAKQQAVFDAQRDVDRTQNELMGTLQDNLVLQLASQGIQLAGSMMPGMDGGMGMGSGAGVVLGIGAGALLVSLFDDDDDDYRRRRRR